MRARYALESPNNQAQLPGIIKYWHDIVFKNITSVPELPSTTSTTGPIDEEAELREALGALDIGEDEEEQEGYDGFFHGDNDYAQSESFSVPIFLE